MTRMHKRALGLGASTLMMAAAGIHPAQAQDAPPPAAAATPQSQGGLEEIIVTAQRRGENLQDTPLAVTAITGDTALSKGVTNTFDLQIVTPGLVIADSGIGPAVYLRGVGTQNTAAGEEGSVSTYVDGVYYSSLPSALASLSNVERVEVLKGPQGTLFGRNATGGLMHIITKTPSYTAALDASLTYATYDTIGADLYATGALGENVSGNFSAYYNDQRDGWGINRTNGRDVYKGRQYAFRGKLLWEPGDATEVTLSLDYANRRDSNTSGAVDEGARGIGGNFGLDDFYDLEASLQPLEKSRDWGGSLTIRHDFSFARLTSISAYRANKLATDFDNDRSGAALADVTIRSRDRQPTQELQIQSLPESAVQWIGGLYYLRNKTHLDTFRAAGAFLAGFGGSTNTPAEQLTKSYAAYAQATVPLGERTNLTGGARYTKDERDLTNAQLILGNGTVINRPDQSLSFNKVTFRVALDHKLSDDAMVYASFNRGFKSGVFNLFATADPPARPEEIDAYEVGFKSELLDRRLRLNGAAFLYKYRDIQLSQAFVNTTRIFNAARATVKGIDLEAVALVADGFTIDANVALLDAEYDDFPGAPAPTPRPATCTPVPTTLPGTPTGGNLNCNINAAGLPMIRSPKFTGSLGARYEWSTSAGTFTIGANYFHSAGFAFVPDNRLRQVPYDLINAQVSWRSPSDRFGVAIFGRNLLDEEYYANRISGGGGDTYSAAAPLTAGITLSVKL